ncbi:MAG: tetratricopeptide repeat protein [Burkholderiales bacterium]
MPAIQTALRAAVFAFLCAVNIPAPSHAAAETDPAFQAGIRASRAGNDREALRQFERAKAAGIDRPALYYNLGVTHYRLGNYAAARENFQRLTADGKMAALAHYNLGLVALRLNDEPEARRHFELAQQRTRDEKLRYLARQQLAELAREAPRFSATVSAGTGYDDNLVVQETGGAAKVGDEFVELFVAGSGTVHGTPRDGVKLSGSLYMVEYLDQDAFSMTFLRGGGARVLPVAGWQAEAGGELELSTLGSRDYLRTLSAQLGGRREIAPDTTLELRYRFSDVRARDAIFSQLDGYQQRFSVDGHRYRRSDWLRGRVYVELNDRDDLREGSVFTSFSPTRAGVRAEYGRRFAGKWEATGSLGYVSSSYRDADVLADGSRVRRSDDQLQAGFGLARELGPSWLLAADYQYYDNDSNLPAYDYRRSIWTLRLTGVF